MTIDRKKSLLEVLKQTLTDEFNKGLLRLTPRSLTTMTWNRLPVSS